MPLLLLGFLPEQQVLRGSKERELLDRRVGLHLALPTCCLVHQVMLATRKKVAILRPQIRIRKRRRMCFMRAAPSLPRLGVHNQQEV
jgi:hypothetical protein